MKGTRVLFGVLAACAITAAFGLWWPWDSLGEASNAYGVDAGPAEARAQAELAAHERSAPRAEAWIESEREPDAASARGARATELLELLVAHEGIRASELQYPRLNGVEGLARVARNAAVTDAELADVLAGLAPDDPRRADILLAHAWTTALDPQTSPRLTAEVERCFARAQVDPRASTAAGLAAAHALRLRGDSPALAALLSASLERLFAGGALPLGLSGLAKCETYDLYCASIEIADAEVGGDPRTRNLLQRVRTLEALPGILNFVSREAWVQLGRDGSPAEIADLLGVARERPGPHTDALAAVRDPRWTTQLDELSDASANPQTRAEMEQLATARSALRGLLGIDDPSARAVLARRLADPESRRVLMQVASTSSRAAVTNLAALARALPSGDGMRHPFLDALHEVARDLSMFHADHPRVREGAERFVAALAESRADAGLCEVLIREWLQFAPVRDYERIRVVAQGVALPAALRERVDGLR